MRPNLQVEAKALGDPTRHRVFRYVAESPVPVGVAELTAHMGLNHNAIRQHLAVLVDAGLLIEEVEAETGRPGRRRLMYRLHPEAAGAWGTTGPYEALARMLAEMVESGTAPRQVGRDAGRSSAVGSAGSPGQALDRLEEEMARRGFRPTRRTRGSKVDFVLGHCPFEDVAATNPATVCELHLGLAEGWAAGADGLEVVRLVSKDARRAGCRLEIRSTGEPPAGP